eukprot:TRINITY_DN13819_c0_g2_i2.p1 TRINITY_DN13819_c0_g2~~TRINITY_DN13819_c0_g2_i2.p1  ORF type:complete len:118 (-),score=10.82 TRINITY_DN13819_c0_g2_i2:43-396(-)
MVGKVMSRSLRSADELVGLNVVLPREVVALVESYAERNELTRNEAMEHLLDRSLFRSLEIEAAPFAKAAQLGPSSLPSGPVLDGASAERPGQSRSLFCVSGKCCQNRSSRRRSNRLK